MNDRFKAEKGLIHFTFANEDKYFKESLTCLNLSQNLYHELKEKGYKTVYFINMSGNNYHITFGDTSAYEAYEACCEKGIFSFLKKGAASGTPENTTYRDMDSSQKKEIANRLLKMMKNKDAKAAYVFTIDAFATLGEYYQDFKTVEEDNYKYKNLILIKAPVEVEGSIKYFSDPYSIYRTDLFSDIQYIFDNYQNARLYEKMQELMPYRISFMNALHIQELVNLVRYVIISEDAKVDARLPLVEDYAMCIWYLYHSRKFRNWVKQEYSYVDQQFPLNPKRLFTEIEEAMRKDTSYRMLDGIIIKIRQLAKNVSGNLKYIIPDVLSLDDYSEEYQNYLYIKNKIWDQIAILSYDFIEDEGTKNRVKTKMEMIRKDLLTACVNQDEKSLEQRQEYIKWYLDDAGTAQAHKDTQSFVYAVEALYYAISKCGEQMLLQKVEDNKEEILDAEKSCLDCYRYILTYQGDVMNYKKKLAEKKQELHKLVEKWEKFLASISGMENQVPDLNKKAVEYMNLGDKKSGIPTKYSNFFEEYLKKKKRAKELGEEITLRKNMIDMLEEKLRHAQKMVSELDISLSSMDLTKGKSFRKEMAVAIDNISIALDKVRDEFIKSSKMKKIEFDSIPLSYMTDLDLKQPNELEEDFAIDDELLKAMDALNTME